MSTPDRARRLLGRDAGGCTDACSEMHTYSWPCEQSMIETRRRPRRFGFRPIFAWYDMRVGLFIDTRKRRAYIFPLPCIGFLVSWDRRVTVASEDEGRAWANRMRRLGDEPGAGSETNGEGR